MDARRHATQVGNELPCRLAPGGDLTGPGVQATPTCLYLWPRAPV